jgi:GNAT superfamily N-acetyltransferase
VFDWRGPFANDELNALHAECFEHPLADHDWWGQVNRFSLGWVTLRQQGNLVGFVNVAWDGGAHAFLLDTAVAKTVRRKGNATQLVSLAARNASESGCNWLHVDFEPHLRDFYLRACAFRQTDAGLIALN